GWGQPAAPVPGWIQPTAAQGPVTILARIAGLFILLLGLLWGVIGAFIVIGGTAFSSITDQFGPLNTTDANTIANAGDVVGGVIAGFGVVIVVLAVIEVLGGLGALFGKTFGRIVGILYSLLFGALLLLALSGATRADTGDANVGTGVLILGAMFAMYLYSLIVLLLRWRGRARVA
ncbi:MAG: hypothetical protein ACRDGQ_02735, partial [Candidatus Limnocylindrales bacterium]